MPRLTFAPCTFPPKVRLPEKSVSLVEKKFQVLSVLIEDGLGRERLLHYVERPKSSAHHLGPGGVVNAQQGHLIQVLCLLLLVTNLYVVPALQWA